MHGRTLQEQIRAVLWLLQMVRRAGGRVRVGIPLDMVKTEQGPGYGAAMLAMVGCGRFKTVQEAADALVEVASTTEPDAALAAKYEARYQNFKKLYPALKGFFAATV